MDHVSRPMLIALAATVALAAIWLVALRPKPVSIDQTPLAPTKAIPAARQASAASDAANAKLQAASKAAGESPAASAKRTSPAASAKSASPTASAKSATATVLPQTAPKTAAPPAIHPGDTRQERAVMAEIRQGKVVVMLFWSAEGADDLATRGAVRSLNLHHGKVKVHVIPIGHLGDYSSITRGVTIAQSPTTLIIGHGGRARTIVGLSEPKELGQAVADAIAGR